MNTEPISVILLAGGTGNRLPSPVPKQFLSLNGKPIIQYSLDVFATTPQVTEIVIVCAPEYRAHFSTSKLNPKIKLSFALPGLRRQDSVYNGLNALEIPPSLVCVHDTARPLITPSLVQDIANAAEIHGAATAAVPVKSTIKESNRLNQVTQTLDRSLLWEIQTPQIIRYPLLKQGFDYATKHNITVTDDASLAELIGAPVQLVTGAYQNIKITTPEDLLIAEAYMTRNTSTID
ncbi:MAG: 2-C-methyl-D-erythritol 4-phosphate cytidylyltransferase [Parachlamydiaceae bacterium]